MSMRENFLLEQVSHLLFPTLATTQWQAKRNESKSLQLLTVCAFARSIG
jgi:hypothetical protein